MKQPAPVTTWEDAKLSQGKTSTEVDYHSLPPTVIDSARAFVSHEGELCLLELTRHWARLQTSAKLLGFTLPYSGAEIHAAAISVLQSLPLEDYYFKFTATKDSLKIVAEPSPVPYQQAETASHFSEHPRGYPTYQMQAKTPQIPLSADLSEFNSRSLFKDEQGYISSGLKSNLFIVSNGALITPPCDGSILPGLTRRIICELFYESSFQTKLIKISNPRYPLSLTEKKLTKSDILLADEVFLTSTLEGIVSVTKLVGQNIGNGQTGDFTKLLHDTYQNIIRRKESYRAATLERI